MNENDLVFDLSARSIDKVVGDVRRFLKEERGIDVSPNRLREGMADVIYRKLDMLADDLGEIFTSPNREEVHELERLLVGNVVAAPSGAAAKLAREPLPAVSVFSGNAEYSSSKLGAMMEYILSKGRTVYKTNLNKLLFYSDLTSFHLRGMGISGAVYLNRPYGPVADEAAGVLEDLIDAGRVTIAERTKHFETAGEASAMLDAAEISVLDWVLDTYGEMSAGEISELSHTERAYRDTRPNEPIACRYAQFFHRLPPADLLERD